MPQKWHQKRVRGLDVPKAQLICGHVPFSTVAVSATYTFPVASGTDIAMSVDTAGAAGNAKRFTAVDDGSQFASLAVATANPTGANDTTITAAAAGTTANGATVTVLGADLGAGATTCYVLTDTTTALTVLINTNAGAGCSTVADFETAVNLSTNWDAAGGTALTALSAADQFTSTAMAGGTEVDWVEYSAPTMTLHYTNLASTVDSAVTAINAATATTGVSSASTDTNLLVTADAVSAQAFTGGVDAVALNTSYIYPQLPNARFTAARTGATGDGTITITFKEKWRNCLFAKAAIRLNSGAAYDAICGIYNATNKTITITPVAISGSGSAVEPTPHANSGFEFMALMEV